MNDLQIASRASLAPLREIAAGTGIDERFLLPYGRDVAKVDLAAIDAPAGRPRAKYVVVSAVTPTPLGEGKTTTTVGLGQAMRQLTGDFHAVTAAHDMLSAMLDNHLFQGNECGIDPHDITWRRVLDVNDRALRNVIVGLGSTIDTTVSLS